MKARLCPPIEEFTMPRLALDPGVYESAATSFWEVNTGASDAVATLSTAVSAGGGMAGIDASGTDWGADYDLAAREALTAGQTLVATLGGYGDLLSASGSNHAAAEVASTCTSTGLAPAAPPAFADAPGSGSRAVGVVVAAPPTASGVAGDDPPGWWLVADVIAVVWPSGDEDRLRSVGAAWVTAGDELYSASDRINVALGDISMVVSPEADQAGAACADLRDRMRAIAEAYRQIGASCNAYADQLVDTRQNTVDVLADCLEWSVANQLVGFIGAAFTAGQSEWLTQGAQLAIVAGYARRIEVFIDALADVVRVSRSGVLAARDSVRTALAAITSRAPVVVQVSLANIATTLRLTLQLRSDWPELADVLAQAARNKGMFGLGTLTAEQAEAVGMAWVGPGARLSTNGKAWISTDGLRQYRPADWKGKFQEYQVNLEWRLTPEGRWGNNGHISIKG